MTDKRVYIARLDDHVPLADTVAAALDYLAWHEVIQPGARVFLKPNLTWREPMPGVTTSAEFIEAVVQVLKTRTSNIIIGESDGGYHSFRAEEAFERHGVYDIARRYNVQALNLTRFPAEQLSLTIGGKRVTVELPSLLIHEVDVFITLPVPKVHAMTRVSLALKNQWGCLPSPMRLHNHPQFARKIIAINKAVKARLALYDGRFFLDRTGPTIGEPVRMNLLIAANDLGAGDLACCQIMKINPWTVEHHLLARQEGMFPTSLDEITFNQPPDRFQVRQFRLRRSLIHWITLAAFKSRLGTRLFYDSIFSGAAHQFLYAIRENPLIGRLLYGRIGPPPVEGGRRA